MLIEADPELRRLVPESRRTPTLLAGFSDRAPTQQHPPRETGGCLI